MFHQNVEGVYLTVHPSSRPDTDTVSIVQCPVSSIQCPVSIVQYPVSSVQPPWVEAERKS